MTGSINGMRRLNQYLNVVLAYHVLGDIKVTYIKVGAQQVVTMAYLYEDNYQSAGTVARNIVFRHKQGLSISGDMLRRFVSLCSFHGLKFKLKGE